MSRKDISKKLIKPFYTYTQQNIQYTPYNKYSIQTIFLLLENLYML